MHSKMVQSSKCEFHEMEWNIWRKAGSVQPSQNILLPVFSLQIHEVNMKREVICPIECFIFKNIKFHGIWY